MTEWPLDPYTGAPPPPEEDPEVFANQVAVGKEIAEHMLAKYGPTPQLEKPPPEIPEDFEW